MSGLSRVGEPRLAQQPTFSEEWKGLASVADHKVQAMLGQVINIPDERFSPSKGQRRTIARLNRYIKNEYVPRKIYKERAREDATHSEEHSPSPEPHHLHTLDAARSARRKSVSPPLSKSDACHADFSQSIHAADSDRMETGNEWRQFKVTLEPAVFTQEKFDLFCEYRKGIHGADPASLKRDTFEASVARTPLPVNQIGTSGSSTGFMGYGTYHHCYYIDNRLVAVAVLDILPESISSDYFYYDPSLACLSLGKYSTLREIALCREIKAIDGCSAMQFYTMGHYVQAASKTHYKSTYHPSSLLDPETYEWIPFEKCVNIIQSKKYFSFSQLDLFEPRVKGLLITMATEKNRVKPQVHSEQSFGPMDMDEHVVAESLQDVQDQESSEQMNDTDRSNHKRKRDNDFLKPLDYLRSGKRPSLTPPLTATATTTTTSSTLNMSAPPGIMDPNQVTDGDLSQLVIYENGKAMMLADSESFKTNKEMSTSMRDYYSAVGPSLAPRMLVFAN
ncbi:Arginyl-tRNA--protein transferase 1 [Podila humilis]|nr:Arginyl-tRNA--protein transferase 1 [Podila humilis]